MLRRLTALQDDLLNILRAGQNGPVEVAYIGVKATIESTQKELLDIDSVNLTHTCQLVSKCIRTAPPP